MSSLERSSDNGGSDPLKKDAKCCGLVFMAVGSRGDPPAEVIRETNAYLTDVVTK